MITNNIYALRDYETLMGAQTTVTVPTFPLSAVTRNRVLRAIDPSYKKGTGKMPGYGRAVLLTRLLRTEYGLSHVESSGTESELTVHYENLPSDIYERLNQIFIAEKVAIRMAGAEPHTDYRIYQINRAYGTWSNDALPASGYVDFTHIRKDDEIKQMLIEFAKRPENAERIQLAVQHVLDGRPLHVTFTKE